ncbi:MAG: phage integrase SAM-like domain-containing protein [Bacillus sp. (in: firmicutes)]
MGRKRKLTIENDKMGNVSLEEAQSIIIKNKEIEGLSIKTVRNYKKFFKHLAEFMKENEEKNVSELTEKDAENFIHYLITKGLQNNTIIMMVLKSLSS